MVPGITVWGRTQGLKLANPRKDTRRQKGVLNAEYIEMDVSSIPPDIMSIRSGI